MDLYSVRQKLNMGISLSEINLRVVDYARVSTDSIKQKKSLVNQVEHFNDYIKKNPNWIYVKSYVDDGISGTSIKNRDNFMRMIEDAKKGDFDLIVTKEISRFSRNTLDSIKYTRLLLSYGVCVLFVNDNINTALPDAELRLTIMASMAQDEIRRLSDRVKFGMNRAIERGEILGNDKLYGYNKNKITKKLEIVDNEAYIVRLVYYLYVIDKLSLSGISKYLKKLNIKTREGNDFSVIGISRMIRNPKYKGYYCGRKSEVIDYMSKKVKYFSSDEWIMYEDLENIPKIVDKIIWDRANERINRRSKSGSNNKKYLYSGKIYCGMDNSVYNRRMFRRNKRDVSWVCSNYLKNGKGSCSNYNIREVEINSIFLDIIKKLGINNKNIIDNLVGYYSRDYDDNIKSKLFNDRNLLYLKRDKLIELSVNNIISDAEFNDRNKVLNNEIKVIDEKLEKMVDDSNFDYLKIEKILEEKLNSNIVSEKIISLILGKIIVFRENDKIVLEIYLNLKNKSPLKSSDYTFIRGDDVKCTRVYNVYYDVDVIFKNQ